MRVYMFTCVYVRVLVLISERRYMYAGYTYAGLPPYIYIYIYI